MSSINAGNKNLLLITDANLSVGNTGQVFGLATTGNVEMTSNSYILSVDQGAVTANSLAAVARMG